MSQSGQRRKGIVVVEDNEADLLLLTRALHSVGFSRIRRLTSKSEVNDLIEKAEAAGEPESQQLPAVMFIDLGLSDGDARDSLAQWKERLGKETLMVVVTGSHRPEELQGAYKSGADSFLIKPAALSDLEHLRSFYKDHFDAAGKTESGTALIDQGS